MSNSLRPGVFSSYSISSSYSPKPGGHGVAVIGAFGGAAGAAVQYTALPYTVPAGNDALTCAARTLFAAGVSDFWCVSVPADADAADYAAAFAALEEKAVYCIVCESGSAAVLSAAKSFAEGQSAAQKERLIFAGEAAPAVAAASAQAVNSERVILVCAGAALTSDDTPAVLPAACAAAAAAALAEDPAASFSGIELPGLTACATLTDAQVETLLAAGVTPLEQNGSAVSCVRLLTTRTATDGAADRTFAPVNTILIIDYVLQSLRGSLRLLLHGARNNAATLSAIGSQVTVLLSGMKEAGVITGYGTPNVYCPSGDPETCIVAVSFFAAYVINQIEIQAHIQL